MGLESVNLAVLFLDDAHLAQEVFYLLSLISSQLQHLSIFRMLHNGSIAIVLLLEVSADLLEVVLRGDSLEHGDGLPSGSLLNANVAESLLGSLLVLELLEGVFGLVKVGDGHVITRRWPLPSVMEKL
ncbi:hypothetical protein PMAYCL1PPCAC_23887, partial [Pristionchus mayeri]